MSEEPTYGLIVSFEDQSPEYCRGFEAGQIWQRMNAGQEAEIETTVSSENRETLIRMAIARGFDAEFKPTEYPEWLFASFTKTRASLVKPNPHGLRLVKTEPEA